MVTLIGHQQYVGRYVWMEVAMLRSLLELNFEVRAKPPYYCKLSPGSSSIAALIVSKMELLNFLKQQRSLTAFAGTEKIQTSDVNVFMSLCSAGKPAFSAGRLCFCKPSQWP